MFVYKYYPVGHKGLWRSGFWYLRESWNQFPMTIVPRKNDLKLAMVSILFSPRSLSSTLRNSCWFHGSNPWPGPISSTLNQSLGSGPQPVSEQVTFLLCLSQQGLHHCLSSTTQPVPMCLRSCHLPSHPPSQLPTHHSLSPPCQATWIPALLSSGSKPGRFFPSFPVVPA